MATMQNKKRLRVTPTQTHELRELLEAQMNGELDQILVLDARKSVNIKDLNSGRTLKPNLQRHG